MVTVITTTPELRALRDSETTAVGFVPTMGNLHAGHISLLDEALKKFKTVYFSIFVNPKQFGPSEDFDKYPRTLENDIALIKSKLSEYPGAKTVVFAPAKPGEVFPPDANQTVSVRGLSTILEGKLRPGHFDGVATVVYRLFELVKPDTAYFGLKDYQQYLVIKQMVRDLALPVKIQGMPIIREATGLALSSRNQYLSPEQKAESLILSQTLRKISELIATKRENLTRAREFIDSVLKDKNWNYLEIRDAETLSDNVSMSGKITILAVYQLGPTRLLDNLQVELS